MYPKLKVNKKEFWCVYLYTLNAYNKSSFITDKEIEIFAVVLSLLKKGETTIKHFSKPHSDNLSLLLAKGSYAEINRVKEGLMKKGLIIPVKDILDKRRFEYELCMTLTNVKNYIDSNNFVSINLPITVENV